MKRLTLLCSLAVGLAACGSTSAPLQPATIDMTGTWEVALNASGVSPAYTQWTLTQSGNSITGKMGVSYYDGTFVHLYKDFGPASGTVSGANYQITATGQGDFSGSARISGTQDGTKLSGTWVGVGANGNTISGSFTGTKQ